MSSTEQEGANAPLLSVLLVNWNMPSLTIEAIRRLRADLQGSSVTFEVVVIDNGSRDPTEADQIAHLGGVRVFRMSHNTGFSGGMNAAAQLARGEILLFLNNDAYPISQGAVAHLVSTLIKDPKTGAVGPGFEGGRENVGGDAPTPVDWVLGAVLMIRRSDFVDAGHFDPAFFAYHEEVLLARVLRSHGRSVLRDPGAAFGHIDGATVRQIGQLQRFLRTRNNWILCSKSPREYVSLIDILRLGRWFLTGILGSLLTGDTRRMRVHLLANWWGARAAVGDVEALEGWKVVSSVFPEANAGEPSIPQAVRT